MDYKAMTKALLDQIEDNFIHRMILHSIVIRLDKFVH